jgi:aminopeptidase N
MIMKKKILLIIFIILMVSIVRAANTKYVHHDLNVTLEPEKQSIRVTDTIHLPQTIKGKKIHFLLHGNLTITSKPKDIEIKKETGELKSEFFGINTAKFEIKKKIPLNHYSISFLTEPKPSFTIGYEGKILHPIKKIGAEYARGFSETPGIISDKGAYLAGASFWVPWFNDDLVTFKLETTTPGPWDVVSQGRRSLHEQKNGKQITVWDSPEPMDEVYLVAGKFTEYGLKVGKVNVMAFLRGPDDNLANKYLETTGQYLEMYEKLIGPYPYSKFALIENFWETGYGMPSFTLLGPKVIRFPFILHSSYPHELLHNWWGNSVFVDYETGNWCEGLTVYLADHLIKEQRSQGEEYRKTTLQGYTHYAAGKKEEFPLTQFKARYDSLSSSIGYGKSMMLFHMLRRQVGDALFNKSIQHFNKHNQYKRATFADIRKSFETVTGKDFKDFFHQWVIRIGAPEIRLSDAVVEKKENGYLLRFSLRQVREQPPYALRIPAAITLEGQKEVIIKHLDTAEKHKTFEFSFAQRPLRIDVDPQFDVFRKLHTNEIPATLSNAFGAKTVLILLPANAPKEFLDGYNGLAETWAKESEGKIEVKKDSEVSSLPQDKAVWLFGWENIHKKAIQTGITGFPAEMDGKSITIDNHRLPVQERSIIAAVKNSKNPSQVVVLLTTDRTAALPGLGRKLPHYGKYSYLAFEGDEPTNTFKGQWAAVNSPMSIILDKSLAPGEVKAKLPRRQPLARLAPLFSSQRMMNHIKYLASEELEGRGLGYKGLEKAAHYIANAFKNAGLKPGGDNGSYYQGWEAEAGGRLPLRNVIGIIPGKNPAYKDQSVILCAHYDHLGLGEKGGRPENKGKIHFGADDNASGTAVMLELAHTLGKSLKPERPIVFIAFTAEENGLLGSSYYVKNLQAKNKKQLEGIMGVVNLDTVGRLTDQKKLLVIGGSSAREWRFIFMGIGYTTGVETELIQQELDSSDQVSFIKAGIPGIQLFSGAHLDYHKPTDTVDKIDAAGLIKVAAVTREAVVYLSERKEPLTVTIKGITSKPTKPGAPKTGRRARTGFMPDFSFTGKGVKIGLVSPGSPAEKAGLKKGDVIIKLGDVIVNDLKEYSKTLKTFKPGDTVTIVYTREGKEYAASITLAAR